MRLRQVAVAILVVAAIAAALVAWLIEDLDVRVLAYLVITVGVALLVGILVLVREQRLLRRDQRRSRDQGRGDADPQAYPALGKELHEVREQLRRVSERLPEGRDPLVGRKELHARTGWLQRKVAESVAIGTRQVDGLLNLHAVATPRVPLVPSDGWAAGPDLLSLLVHLVTVHRPPVVVELGSGTSSVWLGYAVERYGGRVISLDHDEAFATASRRAVENHRLGATVEVRHAPLVPVTVGDWDGRYYHLAALDGVPRIDLLVVDGPPGDLQPCSREPAVPLLRDRFAAAALVVLDDAGRQDEAELMARWRERDGLELERHYRHFASRPAVLRAPPRS